MLTKQPPIEIDFKNFTEGMTTSPDTQDGGFSSETYNISIMGDVGVLRSSNVLTTRLTSTSGYFNGNVIATSGDARISAVGNDKVFITDTGRFYTYKSNVSTLRQTSGGSKTYTAATTDIIQFRGDTFCTSQTDIARLIQSDLTQPNADWESWWTVTQAKTALVSVYRHPMVIFENSLWIADGKFLHKWDGTTSTHGFLTLSDEQSIISLAVDPSTGKMLIGINESLNASNTVPAVSKVLLYNGFSNKPDRAIIVDDMVTAMYPLGGTVYMFYGQRMGYWTGTGIQFLRKLRGVTLDANYLIYKHKVTSIANTLYVGEGTYVLAFGEVQPGKKMFYYPQRASGAALGFFSAIGYVGNNQLGLFYDDNTNKNLVTFDVTYNTAANNGTNISPITFRSLKYKFPRPIRLLGIYVEYADGVTNGTTPGTISIIDDNLNSFSFGSLLNSSGATVYQQYLNKTVLNQKMRKFQLVYSADHAVGILRFLVEWEYAE